MRQAYHGGIVSLPSRERGLKYDRLPPVAKAGPSLPSRERGLKWGRGWWLHPRSESLPSRERGLKSFDIEDKGALLPVAPFTGAWIEILFSRSTYVLSTRRSLHGSVD